MSRISLTLVRTANLLVLLVSMAASAEKIIVIPDKREREYTEYHYAPAIRVGETVILSGIPAGGPGTYKEQVRRMFQRTKSALDAAGARMEDVIEIQTFHVKPKSTADFQKEFTEFLEVHKEFIADGYPAWTAIGNAVLLSPNALVEMRVMAVIGAGKKMRVERQAAQPTPPAAPQSQ